MKAKTPSDVTREQRVKDILAYLNLSEQHLIYVKTVNPSANLPYHGYQHLFTVAIAAYDSANYYFPIDSEKAKLLFLAGLYHDWNHSGGEYSDPVNIARAIVGMTEVIDGIEPTVSKTQVAEIANLIAITEFPHRREPASMEEKIILDADMLVWAEDDNEAWADALTRESNREVTLASTNLFMKQQTIYTSWARTRLFKKQMMESAW